MQTFANTGIKTEVIDEIISFEKNMIYIVDMDRDMQDALRESIRREGRILYEKV